MGSSLLGGRAYHGSGGAGPSGPGDARAGAREERERDLVQRVADGALGLPGAGARVRALEDDPEPIAGEHLVPRDRVEAAPRALAVARDELGGGREALPGPDAAGDHLAPARVGPGREELAEVEQRVADGRELPVEDRGDLARVGREEHVREVVVAVEDPGRLGGRTVALEPVADLGHAGDRGARVAGEGGVALELPAPARDLALEEA